MYHYFGSLIVQLEMGDILASVLNKLVCKTDRHVFAGSHRMKTTSFYPPDQWTRRFITKWKDQIFVWLSSIVTERLCVKAECLQVNIRVCNTHTTGKKLYLTHLLGFRKKLNGLRNVCTRTKRRVETSETQNISTLNSLTLITPSSL